MPKSKDLKRLIRARMEKTGESYTTARVHLLSKDLPLPKNYAKVAGMGDSAVRAATGRDWLEWTRLLDAGDASGLEHREIVTLALEAGASEWWSQMVTVAYERFRGLREFGQRRGGGFDMNRSKTFAVPVDELWRAWRDENVRARFLDVELDVRTESEGRSLRFHHPEEGIIALWFVDKGEKSAVQIQVGGFASREDATEAKAVWSARLDALAGVLKGG